MIGRAAGPPAVEIPGDRTDLHVRQCRRNRDGGGGPRRLSIAARPRTPDLDPPAGIAHERLVLPASSPRTTKSEQDRAAPMHRRWRNDRHDLRQSRRSRLGVRAAISQARIRAHHPPPPPQIRNLRRRHVSACWRPAKPFACLNRKLRGPQIREILRRIGPTVETSADGPGASLLQVTRRPAPLPESSLVDRSCNDFFPAPSERA